jgi:hypothetical protein
LQTKTDPHPKCSKYSKYTQINPGWGQNNDNSDGYG